MPPEGTLVSIRHMTAALPQQEMCTPGTHMTPQMKQEPQVERRDGLSSCCVTAIPDDNAEDGLLVVLATSNRVMQT